MFKSHLFASFLASVFISLLGVLSAHAAVDAKLMRHPDVSQTHIVFSYAEDLWIVSKEGGLAVRLTASPGEETHPKFSPDGKFVAFTAPYANGNEDLYILPITGGAPKRVTHHPSYDRMIDWRPDGEALIYSTDMTSERARYNQLYVVDKDGGLPERLPMPYGEMAAYSPDGGAVVYSYLKDFQNQPDFNREAWKRYRGGRAPDLWHYNLASKESRRLTVDEAPDSAPMWNDRGFFFSSERGDARSNIWALDIPSGNFEQITDFTNDDVTRPSIGPSDIVFEFNGGLSLLNLETRETNQVPIEIIADHLILAPHRKDMSGDIQSADMSADGKAAVFSARGELFTIDIDSGITKAHGASSASAERYPTLSPDGQSIAYMGDAPGEYQLHIRDVETGRTRVMTSFEKGFRYKPFWSPDGRFIAFIDSDQELYLVDVNSGRLDAIDKTLWRDHFGLEDFSVSWSPDSQWLAWSKGLENRNHAVFVYNARARERSQLTSGYYSDASPVFDASGNYIFMLSMRSLSPVYSDMDFTWAYANSTLLTVAPLRSNLRSPLDTSTKPAPTQQAVRIDKEGFEARIEALPIPAGNYAKLFAGDQRAIYLRRSLSGVDDGKNEIALFDLKKRSETAVVSDRVRLLAVGDGKAMAQKHDEFYLLDLAPGQSLSVPLATSDLATLYDRRAESAQILKDAWRFQRDFFYDPGLHGVAWDEVYQKYSAFAPFAVTDSDLSFLLREFVGELSAGHVWAVGKKRVRYEYQDTGLLGADFEISNGAYRIANILDAGPRRGEHHSSLAVSGENIREGEYLLAVNGARLSLDKDPWAAFEGLAGKAVELTIGPSANGANARKIIVTTMTSEHKLRELAWVEGNRQKVEAATNGEVGYIFIPDTSRNGQNELMRQYRAQYKKKGLVIDERFNSGGALGDRLVELLNRPPLVYFSVRSGPDYPLPELSHYGPKALITNGWSYSGGDGFPLLFKAAGVGPLIGERTWGGLIGPAMSVPFVSGGRVAAPPQRVYGTDGEWSGPDGVVPDIEVENDPGLMMQGRDPQLERAIEYVLDHLEEYPPHVKPAYPSMLQ
ncbi:MAG: tricorn protease [Hyphococcus sp.]|nr:MAG: tricorn protease [Marinicaulis sp.]